jgi:S1-C subfamily serine protease
VRVHMAAHKIILAIALAGWLPSMAFAMTPGQVYERVKDSVVVVKAHDQQGKLVGLGSGVVLPSGEIITNYHVVNEGVRYTVGRGKHIVPATLKAGDPDKDLCLLHAPGLVAEPARLGRADRLKVGDTVYAVGAPQGLELSLSEGIISQLRGGGPHPIIQTTVAISPGSSGGGLFNAKGELVGITTFQLKDGQSLNFALPVEWIGEIAGRKIRERPRGEAPVVPAPRARSAATWSDGAEALKKVQDWQGLLAHCLRWTQAEPSNDYAWFSLAFAYGNLGRHGEEIEAYQEGLRLKPNDVWGWYNLALAHEDSGNRSAALEAVQHVRRLNPQKADKLFKYITAKPQRRP